MESVAICGFLTFSFEYRLKFACDFLTHNFSISVLSSSIRRIKSICSSYEQQCNLLSQTSRSLTRTDSLVPLEIIADEQRTIFFVYLGTSGCWTRVEAGTGRLEPMGASQELRLDKVLYQEAGEYRCVSHSRDLTRRLDSLRNALSVQLIVTGKCQSL